MSRRAVAGLIAGLACLAPGPVLAQQGERSFQDRSPSLRGSDGDSVYGSSTYRSPGSGSSRFADPAASRMRGTGQGNAGGDMLDGPGTGTMRGSRAMRTAAVPAGLCGSRPVRTLSAIAALRLAWCLMEADRPLQAVPAFTQAVELGDPATRQEASYGRTLAYLRKDLTAEAAVAAADAPQSRQRNAEVGSTILEQRALAAFRDGRYAETVLHLDDRTRYAPEQTDLMVLRAFAYLRLGRSSDAERMFRAIERAGVPEGAAGLNTIQESLGLVRD